jgi:hypothetical protein
LAVADFGFSDNGPKLVTTHARVSDSTGSFWPIRTRFRGHDFTERDETSQDKTSQDEKSHDRFCRPSLLSTQISLLFSAFLRPSLFSLSRFFWSWGTVGPTTGLGTDKILLEKDATLCAKVRRKTRHAIAKHSPIRPFAQLPHQSLLFSPKIWDQRDEFGPPGSFRVPQRWPHIWRYLFGARGGRER